MTQEQKRIKIAEACGATWTEDKFGNPALIMGESWLASCPSKDRLFIINCPDYFNDINAMHEAEKLLLWSPTQECKTSCYARHLYDIIDEQTSHEVGLEVLDPVEVSAVLLHATAAQRAEAFGLTLNLWTP